MRAIPAEGTVRADRKTSSISTNGYPGEGAPSEENRAYICMYVEGVSRVAVVLPPVGIRFVNSPLIDTPPICPVYTRNCCPSRLIFAVCVNSFFDG